LWDQVQRTAAVLQGRDAGFLDRACDDEWVSLSTYLALLDASARTLGTDALRSMVRRDIVDPSGASFFAPMMRSWARSFQAGPERMLRGAIHVWRSAMRGGAIRLYPVRPGEAHLALEGDLGHACAWSRPFAVSMEGFGLGFMDLAEPHPACVEAEVELRGGSPVLVCRWS
jgi:hypothetical protein